MQAENEEGAPLTGGPVDRSVRQHTPGPWEVTSGDNYEVRSPLIPREYPHHFKDDSTGDFVAYIGNHTKDFGWANACLISAAPDLLEALQRVVKISDLKHDAWDAAKAAIAKALGRDA